MACEASYEERQEDEVDFLQAVFPGDFQDLRVNDSWKVRQPHPHTLTSPHPHTSSKTAVDTLVMCTVVQLDTTGASVASHVCSHSLIPGSPSLLVCVACAL